MTERRRRYQICSELQRAARGIASVDPDLSRRIASIVSDLTDNVVQVTFDLDRYATADTVSRYVRATTGYRPHSASVVGDNRIGRHVYSCVIESEDDAITVRERIATAMRRQGSDPGSRRLVAEAI